MILLNPSGAGLHDVHDLLMLVRIQMRVGAQGGLHLLVS